MSDEQEIQTPVADEPEAVEPEEKKEEVETPSEPVEATPEVVA